MQEGHNLAISFVRPNDTLVLTDDSDWQALPDVADSLATRCEVGNYTCIMEARLEPHGVRAVGMAGNKKNRTRVAKLALAVSLALQSVKIPTHSPMFVSLCKEARDLLGT